MGEMIQDIWTKVKKEEINIMTGALTTFTIIQHVAKLAQNLAKVYPSLRDARYFFNSLETYLAPSELNWIKNQYFYQLFFGIFTYYYTFSKTIFPGSELIHERPLIPIRELYGELYNEFSSTPLQGTEEDIYRFLSNEIPILYNSIVDWIRDHDFESYLNQLDSKDLGTEKYKFMIPFYLREFTHFFNTKMITINLLFITYCWISSLQILGNKSSHSLAKTVFISREYIRRRRKNLFMNGPLVRILQNIESKDNFLTMNSIKWLRRPETNEKSLRLYWRYSLHANNPIFASFFMMDYTMYDLYYAGELFDVSFAYHGLIAHLYNALQKEGYITEKLFLLEDFLKLFQKKLFYPDGIKPMKAGEYFHHYYLSRKKKSSDDLILQQVAGEYFSEPTTTTTTSSSRTTSTSSNKNKKQAATKEVPSSSGAISKSVPSSSGAVGANSKAMSSAQQRAKKYFPDPTERNLIHFKQFSNVFKAVYANDYSTIFKKSPMSSSTASSTSSSPAFSPAAFLTSSTDYSIKELVQAVMKESEAEIKETRLLSIDLLIHLQAFHEFIELLKKEIPLLSSSFQDFYSKISRANPPPPNQAPSKNNPLKKKFNHDFQNAMTATEQCFIILFHYLDEPATKKNDKDQLPTNNEEILPSENKKSEEFKQESAGDNKEESHKQLLALIGEKFVSFWSKYSPTNDGNYQVPGENIFFYIIPNQPAATTTNSNSNNNNAPTTPVASNEIERTTSFSNLSLIPSISSSTDRHYHLEFHENCLNLPPNSSLYTRDPVSGNISIPFEEKEIFEKFLLQYHRLWEISYRITQKREVKQREWIHDQIKKFVKMNAKYLTLYECAIVDEELKRIQLEKDSMKTADPENTATNVAAAAEEEKVVPPSSPSKVESSEKKGEEGEADDGEASKEAAEVPAPSSPLPPSLSLDDLTLSTNPAASDLPPPSPSSTPAYLDIAALASKRPRNPFIPEIEKIQLLTIFDLMLSTEFLVDPELGEWLYASGYGIRIYSYMNEKNLGLILSNCIQKNFFWSMDMLSSGTRKNGFLIPHPFTGDTRFHDVAKYSQETIGRYLVNLGIPLHSKNYLGKTLIPYIKNKTYARHMEEIMNDYIRLADKLFSFAQPPKIKEVNEELKAQMNQEIQADIEKSLLPPSTISSNNQNKEPSTTGHPQQQQQSSAADHSAFPPPLPVPPTSSAVKKKRGATAKEVTEEDEAKAKEAERQLLELLEKEEKATGSGKKGKKK
jgi:hypothetical protein